MTYDVIAGARERLRGYGPSPAPPADHGIRATRGAVLARRALAGAAVLSALAAGPAWAGAGPQGIRPGHNVTVFHNIDMIATFGQEPGSQTQVDVIRGEHLIARVPGTAFSSPDGGALEVNHGPVGPPSAGDCFDGATPDVRPGDRIVVSNPNGPAGVDEVIVDDIAMGGRRLVDVDADTGREYVTTTTTDPATGTTTTTTDALTGDPVTVTNPRKEVWVEGTAFSMNADGTRGDAIALAALDSGGFLGIPADNQLRVAPSLVDAPNGPGTFRARYFADPEFNVERNRNGRSTAYILDALATGDGHAMGYGHVVPLPPVAMLVDGFEEQSGPAPGCEAAPKERSSVGTTSVRALNAEAMAGAAGDPVLTVGGWADGSVGAADVVLSDGVQSVTVPVTLGTGRSQNGWSASFTREQVAGLTEGALTVRLHVAGVPVGVAKTIEYDVTAPGIAVSLPEGTHTGTQRVSVSTGGARDAITYRLDRGTERVYDGSPIELDPGSHTLVLRATDPAGNVTTRTVRYTVLAPPAPPAPVRDSVAARPAAAPAAAIGPALGPIAGSPSKRPALASATVPARVSSTRLRVLGLSAVMRVEGGASVVRFTIHRARGGKPVGTALTAGQRAASGAILRLRFRDRALIRRLKPGRYVLQLTPGTAGAQLGQTSILPFTVTP